MRQPPRPEATRLTVSEARQSFADLVNRVAYGNERITVARHGRDLVGIVPMSDVRRLEALAPIARPGASRAPADTVIAPPRRAGGPRP